MNDELTQAVGALAAVMLPAGTLVARNWGAWDRKPLPKPKVRAVLDEVSLDELLGPWPEPTPYGAVVAPQWHDCPHCCRTTAGSVNRDGWLCGECFTPVGTGAAS